MIYNYFLNYSIPIQVLLHFEKIGILDPEETTRYMLDETGNYKIKFKKEDEKNK